jgi:hypothetical protein
MFRAQVNKLDLDLFHMYFASLIQIHIVVEKGLGLAVLRIRIHRIHMLLGLLDPDPDPLVRTMDPDSSIIKQK